VGFHYHRTEKQTQHKTTHRDEEVYKPEDELQKAANALN
jgi:hypothetical protein